MQRTLITSLILAAGIAVAIALSVQSPSNPASSTDTTATPAKTQPAAAPAPGKAPAGNTPAGDKTTPTKATTPTTPANPATPVGPATPTPAAAPTPPAIEGLHVVAVTQTQPEPTIGSTEFDKAKNPFDLQAQFTPLGGAIKLVQLSRYSTTVGKHDPYTVQQKLVYSTDKASKTSTYLFPMAAYSISVNGGDTIYLFSQRWQVDATRTHGATKSGNPQATFTLTLADKDNKPALRLTRTWSLAPDRYDLELHQQFENLSGKPMQIVMHQIGPMDLEASGGYLGDRRKIVSCYLQPLQSNGKSRYLTTDGQHLQRSSVIKETNDEIWPGDKHKEGQDMVWVALTNRYFAAALHTPVTAKVEPIVPLDRAFPTVTRLTWGGEKPTEQKMALMMNGAPMTLAASGSGASKTQDLSLFTGPQDPAILKDDPAYKQIDLGGLIEYNLGSFCAFCTFAWLAEFLLSFLKLMHLLLADWGMAIIALVAIVRGILHPLTKSSQVNMMKVGRQMQALQPQLEKIKAKYKDNPQKMNQETMALYREKGVNPAAMGLGCLPMLLQMPIWFALYAMLFFAIELRHQPAFYNVFHNLASMVGLNWHFLTDLSAQDAFITLPGGGVTIPFLNWNITAINLLPILMAFVFFVQQKYTTQTTPQMSENAATQQKMMKFMTLLFPLFLYKAPSGLTLYILTSTSVGIIESKRVRNHIKEMEDRGEFDMDGPGSGKGGKGKAAKSGGFWDRVQKAAEQKQREAQKAKSGGKGKKRGR